MLHNTILLLKLNTLIIRWRSILLYCISKIQSYNTQWAKAQNPNGLLNTNKEEEEEAARWTKQNLKAFLKEHQSWKPLLKQCTLAETKNIVNMLSDYNDLELQKFQLVLYSERTRRVTYLSHSFSPITWKINEKFLCFIENIMICISKAVKELNLSYASCVFPSYHFHSYASCAVRHYHCHFHQGLMVLIQTQSPNRMNLNSQILSLTLLFVVAWWVVAYASSTHAGSQWCHQAQWMWKN